MFLYIENTYIVKGGKLKPQYQNEPEVNISRTLLHTLA